LSALIAARRLHIERFLVRGLSQREIVKALARQSIINPKTGKPWSLGTVSNDVQAIEDQWSELALEERFKRKAKITAELQELKRQAWATRDYKLVADLIKQERDLYNLDEPVGPLKVHHFVSGDVEHHHQLGEDRAAIEAMDEQELDLFIQNMLVAGTGETAVIDGDFEVMYDDEE
jgi:transposase